MKRIFLFLFLASLGVAISFISATNSSSYTEKISYHDGNYKSQKAWASAVLSSDKTKMFVINVTEQREIKKQKKFYVLFTATKYDTLETCPIQKEAQIFLNDSNVIEIMGDGVIHLPDSIVPRWTHIFGKDTAVKRSIKVSNGEVCIFTISEYVNPIRQYILRIMLIITLILIFVNFIIFNNITLGSWLTLICGIFMISVLFTFSGSRMTWFDAIFFSNSFVLVTIISLFIKTRKKKKDNRNFNKQ